MKSIYLSIYLSIYIYLSSVCDSEVIYTHVFDKLYDFLSSVECKRIEECLSNWPHWLSIFFSKYLMCDSFVKTCYSIF